MGFLEWLKLNWWWILLVLLFWYFFKEKTPNVTMRLLSMLLWFAIIAYVGGFMGWADILRMMSPMFLCYDHKDSLGSPPIPVDNDWFCYRLGGWTKIWRVDGGQKGRGCIFVPRISTKQFQEGVASFCTSRIVSYEYLPIDFRKIVDMYSIKEPYRIALSPVNSYMKEHSIFNQLLAQSRLLHNVESLLARDFKDNLKLNQHAGVLKEIYEDKGKLLKFVEGLKGEK